MIFLLAEKFAHPPAPKKPEGPASKRTRKLMPAQGGPAAGHQPDGDAPAMPVRRKAVLQFEGPPPLCYLTNGDWGIEAEPDISG
eukprot:667593-Pyramimonas_sp.AAC.1